MKETADEAVALSPSVGRVIVYRRLGREIPWSAGRDVGWPEAVAGVADTCPVLEVEADHPCLIIYTSGTTGKPKGAVLTHGGFFLKAAHDFAYCHDVGESDRLFWLTDLGWLMGPMLITAALSQGATAMLFEGVPDHPKPDRLWALVERHRITVMGLSPTAVRALMPHGPEHVHAHDLSSLRMLGSTGEPWNPEPYRWLFENAGKARIPISNYTGGTEISGGILGCFPIAPITPSRSPVSSACRTRSRARRSSASWCCAQATSPASRCAGNWPSALPPRWARRSSPRRCSSRAICPRRAARRSCAA